MKVSDFLTIDMDKIAQEHNISEEQSKRIIAWIYDTETVEFYPQDEKWINLIMTQAMINACQQNPQDKDLQKMTHIIEKHGFMYVPESDRWEFINIAKARSEDPNYKDDTKVHIDKLSIPNTK
jgi:hypothetical protein